MGDPTREGLDYLTFTEHAVTEAARQLPDLDVEAMRLVLLMHRVTSAVVYDLESRVHRPAGWTWSGFRLLFVLWIAGPVDSTTAAELSGMSRAAVSALARTLVDAGLVARTADPTDARSVVLDLTPAGVDGLVRAYQAHNDREAQWASMLDPDERAVLTRLLAKLAAGARQGWVSHRT